MTGESESGLRYQRVIGWFVVVLLIATGSMRAHLLAKSRSERADLEQIETVLAALTKPQGTVQQLGAVGVTATPLRFDPSAQVILACGLDGKPGRARFDDNFDRVVDNSLELGAVGSDDVCLVPWQSTYQDALTQEGTRTISVGTFMPVENAAVDVELPKRWLVAGKNWTWIVVR